MEKVQIQINSQTAQSVFYKGGTKQDIQQMAMEIWDSIDELKLSRHFLDTKRAIMSQTGFPGLLI